MTPSSFTTRCISRVLIFTHLSGADAFDPAQAFMTVRSLASRPTYGDFSVVSARLSNHFFALGRRCGQPGQQQGRRLPAWSSSTARLILRLRVVPSLAETTQQIHSFRASGVRSFQAAFVVASEPRALRKSAGVLCTGPDLLSFFI